MTYGQYNTINNNNWNGTTLSVGDATFEVDATLARSFDTQWPTTFDFEAEYRVMDQDDIMEYYKLFTKDVRHNAKEIDLYRISNVNISIVESIESGAAGVSRETCNPDEVEVEVTRSIWGRGGYTRLFLMYHELGHDILDAQHVCNANSIMQTGACEGLSGTALINDREPYNCRNEQVHFPAGTCPNGDPRACTAIVEVCDYRDTLYRITDARQRLMDNYTNFRFACTSHTGKGGRSGRTIYD